MSRALPPVRAFILLLSLWSLAVLAQDGGPTGVLTRPPAVVKQVEAVFPASQLDAGVGAGPDAQKTWVVKMEIDLGADGLVTDARITESAGAEFDQAALDAVKQFIFSPAEIDGKPAAVRIGYSYTFLFRPEVPLETADAGVKAPVINLQGTLLERGTRNPLPAAQIAIGDQVEVSNDDGTFAFKDLPPGPTKVIVTAPGYVKFEATEEIAAGKRTEVTYFVRKQIYGAFETVVRAQKERKEVAQVTLKQEEIRLIPGTQGDAFKVVQNLPGVARSPFGIGLLVVRGGKPWDTRTYVDDATIPLLFHFGGLYATFNSALLQELSFSPGNFGAGYGRNIGGLVQATVRTPSKQGIHGYVDINLIDASALIEAPVSENWSISASARRSYIDILLPAILRAFVPKAKDALSFSVAPQYLDYQLRAEWKPQNGRQRFYVSFFGSSDRLKILLPNPALDPEGRGEFGTFIAYQRLTFGYEHRFSDTLRFTTHNALGLDNLSFTGGSDIFLNGVQYPVQSRNTFSWAKPDWNLAVDFGLDLALIPLISNVQTPPLFKLNQIPDPFLSRQLIADQTTVITFEPSIFAELVFKPFKSLKVVAGIRGDYESLMNKGWVNPRAAVFFTPWDKTTFKAAAGIYHQPPDYRQGQLSAKFGNPNLLPEGARHYMVGWEQRFTDAIGLDLQLYYKDLFWQSRQTLAPGSGDVNVDAIDLNYTSTGFGKSFGAELLLRHQLTKNFFGWIAYSLSRTERDYYAGKEYGLAPLDQPHNLIVIASYKLPYDFIVGARMRYSSGPLNTPYAGAIYDANGNYYYPLFGKPWSRRLPDFFQLDVRIDKRFVFQKWMLALYLDVQNVTNRQNVESVTYNYDYSREQFIYGLPILPSLGVRAEW